MLYNQSKIAANIFQTVLELKMMTDVATASSLACF